MTVITGEGGSGGALAIAVGDVVLALENAIYSVISPEGCASILWRTSDAAQQAAVAMRLTAGEQAALGVVDRVIPEAGGGAHDAPAETAARLRASIEEELERLTRIELDELVDERYARYRRIGEFVTTEEPRSKRRNGVASRPGSAACSVPVVPWSGPVRASPRRCRSKSSTTRQSTAPLGEEV